MAQHEPNMVPTWPKMSQHSPKWPKISPIWSQLLPNKGQHKPQNTPKSAQHEPNMVPTLAQHPRSAQHGQKSGRRSQNCTFLFCKSKIGFAHAPCPPMSLRSGKHNLSAACTKDRNTNNQKITAKTISNAPQKLLLSWYLCYVLRTCCMDENSTTLKCVKINHDKPNMVPTLAQQRPTQTTKSIKMAQHEPNMVPT